MQAGYLAGDMGLIIDQESESGKPLPKLVPHLIEQLSALVCPAGRETSASQARLPTCRSSERVCTCSESPLTNRSGSSLGLMRQVMVEAGRR